MGTKVKPYADSADSKKQQVAQMFDNISVRYDFLNHLLSFNIDKLWRKKVVRMASRRAPKQILDVATGTADLALALRQTDAQNIVGVDISAGMLDIGRQKIKQRRLDSRIRLDLGDSEALPYDDQSFDLVTVAFGVRNFENLDLGLAEIFRVLRPGGQLLVLEFSQPQTPGIKQGYRLYSRHILPRIGRLFSQDHSAYTYLPDSVDAFPFGEAFLEHMRGVGFESARCTSLTFGVASIYEALKPA